VIDVTSLDALVTLAEKYESVIVEHDEAQGPTYLVWDAGMLFRYTAARASVASDTETSHDEAISPLRVRKGQPASAAEPPTPKSKPRSQGARRKPSA
jgi:hypothetical protein